MRQLVIALIPNVHHGFRRLQRYRLAAKTLRASIVTGFYPDFVTADGAGSDSSEDHRLPTNG
ncbi:hypothetical protein IH992_18875 [Candidatus Poribacteria bacterium]|nr:hypothetical protein [Candidatus Poribacteria bacterium]